MQCVLILQKQKCKNVVNTLTSKHIKHYNLVVAFFLYATLIVDLFRKLVRLGRCKNKPYRSHDAGFCGYDYIVFSQQFGISKSFPSVFFGLATVCESSLASILCG